MRKNAIENLLSIASPPLSTTLPGAIEGTGCESLKVELSDMLSKKNGFYCFESALHVFPSHSSGISVGLNEWNSPSSWRREYGDLSSECLFFAEDGFGGQFCFRNEKVWVFEPETGECTELAKSLEEWAAKILDDFAFLTGFPVLHAWQMANGAMPLGSRLVPKVPFVCGGAYAPENLKAMEAVEGMRLRGGFASKIRKILDGGRVAGW